MKRLFACIGLAGLALVTLATSVRAQGGGWSTTKWTVACTDFVLARSDTLQLSSATPAQQLANSELCRNRPSHPITNALESASLWLEGLGFNEPDQGGRFDPNAMREDTLLAYAPPASSATNFGQCAVVHCVVIEPLTVHGLYDPPTAMVVLSPVTPNGPPAGVWRLENPPDAGWGHTEAHELFHAVQHAYPGFDAFTHDDDGWISEGTAQAVEKAAIRTLGAPNTGEVFRRQFDSQLHIPPSSGGRGSQGEWAYGSWKFWAAVGARLGSQDGVQYLHDVFDQFSASGGGANGLNDVETTLKGLGASLYTLYPLFVADSLSEACHFSDLADFNDDFGVNCTEKGDNEYRFAMSFPDTVQRLNHQLKHMATAGYEVRFDVPAGKTAQFTARVPDFVQHPHLHLIVDGRYYNLSPRGPKEAVIQFPPGRDSVKVRLAAAPNKPGTSELGTVTSVDVAAPIEFMLTELDPCRGDELVKTIRDPVVDSLPGSAQVQAALAMAPGFMDVPTYQNMLEQNPDLRPSMSMFAINGLVADGGAGCTDPFGTGFYNDGSPPPGPDTANIDIAALTRAALAGQDPAEIMGMLMGTDPSTQDAVFFTFSPNAFSWQTGMAMPGLNRDISGFEYPIEHAGAGGWNENAAAAVTIRLPGVPPDSVKPGRTYNAVVDAPSGEVVIYTQWTGQTAVAQCATGRSASLLEGRTETVYVEPLAGTVSVTAAGSGVVEGTFALGGNGRSEVWNYEFRRDSSGQLCGMDSNPRTAQNTTGYIQLSGTLVAPARVATMRPGRVVTTTVAR